MHSIRKPRRTALGLLVPVLLATAVSTSGCVTLFADHHGALEAGHGALMPFTLLLDVLLSPLEALYFVAALSS